MSVKKPVSPQQIRSVLAAVAQRRAPVTLTCRLNGAWQNYTSRFLGLRSDGMWVEYPGGDDTLPDFPRLDKLGVAFKQGHHKYVFSTAVLIAADFRIGTDQVIRGLRLSWPQSMYQLQRRLFERTRVPDGWHVFVHFWLGGLTGRSTRGTQDLTCVGELVDLSAGGFGVRLLGEYLPPLRCGEPIGANIIAPDDRPTIQVDAQFRHATKDEHGTTLGLQMMGLTETSAGQEALEVIHRYISEFRRSAPPRARAS